MSGTHDAQRRYNRRLLTALLAYAVLLGSTILLLNDFPDAPWRYPVALVPMIPSGYLVWAVVHYLREIDELQRRIQLEGLGFAFAAGSVITFGYGFLQLTGLPEASWFYVWPVYGTMWMLGVQLARRRYISPHTEL